MCAFFLTHRAAVAALEVEKKTKKAQIKEWMADFEQKEGRPPTNQDKEVSYECFSYEEVLDGRGPTKMVSFETSIQSTDGSSISNCRRSRTFSWTTASWR